MVEETKCTKYETKIDKKKRNVLEKWYGVSNHESIRYHIHVWSCCTWEIRFIHFEHALPWNVSFILILFKHFFIIPNVSHFLIYVFLRLLSGVITLSVTDWYLKSVLSVKLSLIVFKLLKLLLLIKIKNKYFDFTNNYYNEKERCHKNRYDLEIAYSKNFYRGYVIAMYSIGTFCTTKKYKQI